MLGDPGVVGGALEGDVESHLHAVVVRGGDQSVEVAQGTELRVNGFVTAFFCADGPRAAGVVWRGGHAVVAALANGGADGVEWREVEHVEAHGGDAGQERFDVGEGSVAVWVGGGGSGEELVPGGGAGGRPGRPQ